MIILFLVFVINFTPGVDDLADVLTELEPVEFRYFEIGTMLHLRHHVLNRIRSLNSVSFSMRMSEMITEWLKLNLQYQEIWASYMECSRHRCS